MRLGFTLDIFTSRPQTYHITFVIKIHGLLTSGNTEMLLFSRFSSSSSRHCAKDLGIADNLLYLRPKRFMLAKFPEIVTKNIFTVFFVSLLNAAGFTRFWGKQNKFKKALTKIQTDEYK